MSIDSGLTCKYCGHHEAPNRYQAKEMMFGTKEIFHIGGCKACGSLHLLDIPQSLSPYYPSDYYSFSPLVASGSIKRLFKKWRYSLYSIGLGILSPIFGQWVHNTRTPKTARIADIGCGNGQLLYEMHAAGFHHLEGYDPFLPSDQGLTTGLKLYKKSVDEIEGSFDLIMMHHSLEHMEDPESILRKCKDLLFNNGMLLIRIPIADAKVWKEEKSNWVQLDVPRHLHIPSISGMKMLAKKLGFKLKSMDFDSTSFQFWGTELYKRGISLREGEGRLKEIFGKDLKKFQKKALLYNKKGIGDQACFYFIKEA